MANKLIVPLFAMMLICFCSVTGIATYVSETKLSAGFEQIFEVFKYTSMGTVLVIAFILITGLIIGLAWATWQGWEFGLMNRFKRRLMGAQVLQAERDARLVVTTAPPGYSVVAHQLGSNVGKLPIYHNQLHLNPSTRVNGVEALPTLDEIRNWMLHQMFHSQAKPGKNEYNLLDEGTKQPLPERVYLEQYASHPTLNNLFLGIGRSPDGTVGPVSAPLASLVHIAVAGSSGFGKSTFMQDLAWQCVNAKEQPACVLLDAQGVTFTQFTQNLLYPLASEPKDIRAILAELFKEMERRQKLFSAWVGIDRLSRYNAATQTKGLEPLPEIPVIFDEFGLVADDKEIAYYTKKLSQGGRKTGIYIIAGSQTWGADEISTALRANLSTSVQFNARDKAQSRVLLGDSAAASLTRPGQAYVILPGRQGLIELITPDPSGLIEVEPLYVGDSPDFFTAMRPMPVTEEIVTVPVIDPFRVLELFDSGEFRTPTAICNKLLGYKNSKVLGQVKSILLENERIG